MNQGQLIGLAFVGTIIIAVVFLAYALLALSAIVCSILVIAIIQSKHPVVYQNGALSTFIYSVLWGITTTLVLFYTSILLIPVAYDIYTLREFGERLGEVGLTSEALETGFKIFAIVFITCIFPDKTKSYHKGLRLTAILTCVGGIEGLYAFGEMDFRSTFFGDPSNVTEAIVQGISGNFLVPIEIGVFVFELDPELRILVIEKYEINPFNPYSYMNMVSLFAWLWTTISLLLFLKPAEIDNRNFDEHQKNSILSDDTFSGVSFYFLGIFLCHTFFLITLNTWGTQTEDITGQLPIFLNLIASLVIVFIWMATPIVMLLGIGLVIFAPIGLYSASSSGVGFVGGSKSRSGRLRLSERELKSLDPNSVVETRPKVTEASTEPSPSSYAPLEFTKDLIQKKPQQAVLTALEERIDSSIYELERNAQCPCGSGKRVKHCHGKLDLL